MELQELIIVDLYCKECQIEITLIEELADFGLINLIQEDGARYIHSNELPHLQRVIQFHNDLNINKEGIEVILNLLDRLNQQNQDIRYLQEKLKLYE